MVSFTFGKNFSKNSVNLIKEVIYKGNTLKEDFPITNAFSEFFSTIGENLAKDFPKNNEDFKKYLPDPQVQSMFIDINVYDILYAIKELKNSKSIGPDGLNSYIIKQSGETIIPPLLHIFNSSLKNGIFPDKLKIARIVPIFKKGPKND